MAAVVGTAAAAKLISLLPKLYASKHFLPLLLGGAFLGQEALGQVGKARERGLTREQLQLQKLLSEAQAEATKRATKESREQAGKYMRMLTEEKGKERAQARTDMLMQYFMSSQDRQIQAVMQALQGISQARPRYQAGVPASGMVGLMRG